MIGRDTGGRFAIGFSPDRGRGRAKAAPTMLEHTAARATVLALANLPVTIRPAEGRRRTVSLFEAMMHRLATGQTSRRTSPAAFIRLVIACARDEPPSKAVSSHAYSDPDLKNARQRFEAVLATGIDDQFDAALADYMVQLRS